MTDAKVCPREPTEAMEKAALAAEAVLQRDSEAMIPLGFADIWRAMYDAAPTPPAAPDVAEIVRRLRAWGRDAGYPKQEPLYAAADTITRLAADLAQQQEIIGAKDAEIARLRACVEAADRVRVTLGEHGRVRVGERDNNCPFCTLANNYDAARALIGVSHE